MGGLRPTGPGWRRSRACRSGMFMGSRSSRRRLWPGGCDGPRGERGGREGVGRERHLRSCVWVVVLMVFSASDCYG